MAVNVLIVDDSLSMRAIIKKTIKVAGFEVGKFLEAEDGKKAMRVLVDEWVDILLTDINMPNMNGIELIGEMKKDEVLSLIPVVMVTTEGSEKRIKEAMEMGAKGYIMKPFLPEEIKEALSTILGEAEYVRRDLDKGYEGRDF
jgi:two-component system, chemotaxis family, chemotaxis protein CheY